MFSKYGGHSTSAFLLIVTIAFQPEALAQSTIFNVPTTDTVTVSYLSTTASRFPRRGAPTYGAKDLKF